MRGERGQIEQGNGRWADGSSGRAPGQSDTASIAGPVLILHGEGDANAPLAQARALEASDVAGPEAPFLQNALK